MDDILQGLNDPQLEAVKQQTGAMLVLAGAGSGKTRVLTTRIAHLIRHGVNPREILAVTFTNKAAKEMRERLERMLGSEIVRNLWVGTFHSICAKILRFDIKNYSSEEGRNWADNFTIFDQDESMQLIKQAVKAENLDDKIYAPKMIKSVISMAKNKMQTAYEYATNARDYRSEKIALVFDRYEKLLAENNGIDFDDLLLLTVKLLATSPDVLNKYNNRFRHILVDEFQDTNQTQYELINLIYSAGQPEEEIPKDKSLCVVGDVDQSIYSWRGADYKIILNFQKAYQNSSLIKLEQNYRSTETILDAANKIILNNTERLKKDLFSIKGKGDKITKYEAASESDEANFIARKILSKVSSKQNYNDFTVLYRTNAQSRAIEEAFMAKNIPYKIIGGLKFYDRKEIKDTVAYLKILFNPSDNLSLKRIINVPKRSIGKTTIEKLEQISQEKETGILEIIEEIDNYPDFNVRTKGILTDFLDLLKRLGSMQGSMSLSEFISFLLEKTGYINELKEEDSVESQTRLENLQEFLNVARDFEEEYEEIDLGEFLSQIALVSDVDELDEEKESVTLMTLHSAKGLEFPQVFLAGLEEGIFPHSRAQNSNSEMEEERRLMYVGITRAQDKLYITHAKRRQVWGEIKYFTPSRFLDEIPAKLVEEFYSGSIERTESTFKTAVDSLKSKIRPDIPASSTTALGFGKNFVAPQLRKKQEEQPKPQPKQTFQKPQATKAEKTINSIADARAAIERIKNSKPAFEKKVEPVLKEKTVLEKEPKTKEEFHVNNKVFHDKFGKGTITEIIEISSSSMYVIEFENGLKKGLDASFAKLAKLSDD
ncbi:MAG: 3'-5' exonuclease [Candidatus Gastranaerophilales bacterium]|nr:3'-5' exonuclease [Candidatus Gastranaerophilales bacterium]